MKIVFAGTPEFARKPLRALHAAGFEVVAVLTQPDKPQGRKGILTPPPMKTVAEELGISVLQPARLKEDCSALKALKADCMVTCAYGQILTQEVLDLFPKGVWNIHASLLPAYRGAAPIPRVIIDGCAETGVTIMKTDIGLDTGDMLLKQELAIEDTDTAETLSNKLSACGAELIVTAMKQIEDGNYTLIEQGDGAFTCKKVQRTQVDFTKSAREVSCLIRGLSPAPLCFGTVGDLVFNFYFAQVVEGSFDAPAGTVVCASPKQGLIVSCGEGAVRITELQAAGGKRMSARDFLNGGKLKEGARFDLP